MSISRGGSTRVAERLLHIDASPRGERSRSRIVASAFLAELEERRPDIEVTHLDLWALELPSLGDGMIEGRYELIMGKPVPESTAAAWEAVRAHVDHFLDFDHILISTPMWNFGVPYRLKHYVDVLTQPGMAFTNDALGNVVGHAAGRRAVIIAASALDIRPAGPLAGLDFQLAYLVAWLRFIGVEQIDTLRVAPTFGPPEAVEVAMRDGLEAARRLAAQFAAADAARA